MMKERMGSPQIMLVNSVEHKLITRRSVSLNRCIYKVPDRFRRTREEAYKPEVVSIGPYHYGRERLQAMVDHKWRYLYDFLNRKPENTIKYYLEKLTGMQESAYQRYAETIWLETHPFVEMLLLDGSFLVEFILKALENQISSVDYDPFIKSAWIRDAIKVDILLLENQLPFFILKYLYSEINGPDKQLCGESSFLGLAERYLRYYMGKDQGVVLFSNPVDEPKHLADLLLKCLSSAPIVERNHWSINMIRSIPSASKLYVARVKFNKLGKGACFLDVRFTRGCLEIPPLTTVHKTDPILRNLIVLDHLGRSIGFVTDYMTFMDNLIHNSDDVIVLRNAGIVDSSFKDEFVLCLFKKFGEGTITRIETAYFKKLFDDVNEAYGKSPQHLYQVKYYKAHWPIWKENLKQKYVNNLWDCIKVFGAVAVFISTLIGSVCAVLTLIWQT